MIPLLLVLLLEQQKLWDNSILQSWSSLLNMHHWLTPLNSPSEFLDISIQAAVDSMHLVMHIFNFISWLKKLFCWFHLFVALTKERRVFCCFQLFIVYRTRIGCRGHFPDHWPALSLYICIFIHTLVYLYICISIYLYLGRGTTIDPWPFSRPLTCLRLFGFFQQAPLVTKVAAEP